MDFSRKKYSYLFDPILPKQASSLDLLLHLGTGSRVRSSRTSKTGCSEHRNPRFNEKNIETIIAKCCSPNKIQVPGCIAVNDQLFYNLCHVQTLQQNLLSLNIYGTSVSPEMAASVFHSFPFLEAFVYHDVAGFLYHTHINSSFNASSGATRKRACKLQLGMVHDAAIHLTFSNCETCDLKSCKELELYLPTGVSEGKINDIFHFTQDKYGMYEFSDIYRVIVSVKPEKLFGGWAAAYPLTEMSLFSVKDISLDLIFSTLKQLKKMILHSCFIKSSLSLEENYFCPQSESVTTLYLCNIMNEDVVRLLQNCPNLKELHLYDLQITNSIFECMDNTVKISMKNCFGCPLKQILYRLQLPRYFARLKQCMCDYNYKILLRQFFIFCLIILPIYLFVFIFNPR